MQTKHIRALGRITAALTAIAGLTVFGVLASTGLRVVSQMNGTTASEAALALLVVGGLLPGIIPAAAILMVATSQRSNAYMFTIPVAVFAVPIHYVAAYIYAFADHVFILPTAVLEALLFWAALCLAHDFSS